MVRLTFFAISVRQVILKTRAILKLLTGKPGRLTEKVALRFGASYLEDMGFLSMFRHGNQDATGVGYYGA